MATAPTPRKPAAAAAPKRAPSPYLRGSRPTKTLGSLLSRPVSMLEGALVIAAEFALIAALAGPTPAKAEPAVQQPVVKTATAATPE